MTKYTPENLTPYERPKDYMGPDYYDYYPVAGQHRDSEPIERSNYIQFKRILSEFDKKYPDWRGTDYDGDPTEAFWVDVRDSHWAVGWVETIYLHKDAPVEVLREIDELVGALQDYCVINDEHLSELEYEEHSRDFDNWAFKEFYRDNFGGIEDSMDWWGDDFRDYLEAEHKELYELWLEDCRDHWHSVGHDASSEYIKRDYECRQDVQDIARDWLLSERDKATAAAIANGKAPEFYTGTFCDWQTLKTLTSDDLGNRALHCEPLTIAERVTIAEHCRAGSEPWRLLTEYIKDYETSYDVEL